MPTLPLKPGLAKLDKAGLPSSLTSDRTKVAELLTRARAVVDRPRVPQILHPMICSVHGGRYLGIIEQHNGSYLLVGSQQVSWKDSRSSSTAAVTTETVNLVGLRPHSSWSCPMCQRPNAAYKNWLCGCEQRGLVTVHCGGEGEHAQVSYCACGKHQWRDALGAPATYLGGQLSITPGGCCVHGERYPGCPLDSIEAAKLAAQRRIGINPSQIENARALLPGRK